MTRSPQLQPEHSPLAYRISNDTLQSSLTSSSNPDKDLPDVEATYRDSGKSVQHLSIPVVGVVDFKHDQIQSLLDRFASMKGVREHSIHRGSVIHILSL